MMRRAVSIRILAAAVFCVAGLDRTAPKLRAEDDPAAALVPEIQRLVEVYATVESEAADEAQPERAFYEGAIPGMLRTLDPHSSFFDPSQFEQLKQMQRSEEKGFGTIVNVVPGRVIILQTMENSPSAKAGLEAGDEILAINNIALAPLEPEQLIQLLAAARQKAAALDIRHPGNARIFRITLQPELIDSPSVDRSFEIAPGIGYVRIKSFDMRTGSLAKEVIEKLGGANLKGLVLDLRDNPGGAVQAAAETASLFLAPKQLIFSIRGRNQEEQQVRVPDLAEPYRFPLTVLVDGRTASAAEILTGALQDHDRATILGEPTYGKGLVQNVFPLSNNTGVALTVAFYYTPSGRSIQKPLASGSLDLSVTAKPGLFYTESGREVHGGGGIEPDELVWRSAGSRLLQVIDATGALTTFASEYVQSHSVDPSFEVTAEILDQLQVYLSARNIRPNIADWLRDRDAIQSKLKQEIFNLKFGVEKGDQIEMQRDPVVQRAREILSRSH
jgi:carboxyl-terminal processing protease